jgi:CMP-N-acetylneuraminic acid synthetase
MTESLNTARRTAVAVIPARGGSKGIPRKNILEIGGKPLIAHAILAAKGVASIDRVLVSTDDHDISKVARDWGAEVVSRPSEISGDLASSESALLHVLEELKKVDGRLPDLLVFLQCTSPFTASEDIDGTISALIDQQAQTALAVTPFHYFVWREDPAQGTVGVNHDKSVRLMRQQREPQFLETGAVYVMDVQGFLTHKHRFFGKTAMHVIPADRVMEIDEPEDVLLAEARFLQHARKAAGL